MPRDSRYSYSFPAPPVYTGRWTERDWLRYARRHGHVERRGPAPSFLFMGKALPLAVDVAGNVLKNSQGQPLYDWSRAFQPVFPEAR